MKPLRRSDYTGVFTDVQWAQLHSAFPTGVCDYSKPGVGQRRTVPWLIYADGPGGEALGTAPLSIPFGRAAGTLPVGGLPATGLPTMLGVLAVALVGGAVFARRALRRV